MATSFRYIGRPVPIDDGLQKAAGTAVYTQDFELEDMLHAAVVRSPWPHARIVGVDVTKAAAAPGVRVVISGFHDVDRAFLNYGPVYADRYPLARDRVRFVGEEVVAIAADTLAQARAATQLVEVQYEPLPAAMTIDEALAPSAPNIHERENLPLNVAQVSRATFGELEAAFTDAYLVLDDVFEHGLVAPICLETNGAVASFDSATRSLQIWAPTQAPFFVRKEIAHILGLERDQVTVRSVVIGGGFGGKSQCPEPIGIVALLSKEIGRPVKLVLTRQEEFLSGKTDHGKRMRVRSAFDSEGNVLGRHTEFVVDNGAYTHMGPAYISGVRQRTCNLYRVAAAGFDGKLVHTNKVSGGSYRGMGAPQIIWAIESQVERAARTLGKDSLAYRIAIANQPGDETPLGWKIGTCALQECLEEAGRRIGWEAHKANPRPNRGIGFASMINPSVGVLYPEGNFANVSLELTAEGRLLLGTQAADAGTGQNTVLAQLAAEALSCDDGLIDVVHMDTEIAPDDLGSAASRVTFVTGSAALDAGHQFEAAIKLKLAQRWDAEPADITVEDGWVRCGTDNVRRLSWREVFELEGNLRVEGHHEIDLPRPDPATGYGHYAATYGFGAQAVEVEVDPATGHVRVIKVVVVQDMGRVINPLTLEGQMHGGIVQGIGMALQEELVLDHGQPVNATLVNYRVPRNIEAPEIECHFIETNDPTGPLGAKAGGEHSINPAVAAISNAITDATGLYLTSLPMTPQKILSALVDRDNAQPQSKPWKRPFNVEVAAVRAMYPTTVFPLLKKLGSKLSKGRRQVSQFDYECAQTVEDAIELLRSPGGTAMVVAGGTDVYVGTRQGIYAPSRVIDVNGVDALRAIVVEPHQTRIGAAVTLSELVACEELKPNFSSLVVGARGIATTQIRNVATVAGNLCQEKRCWFFRSAFPCYKFGGATCPCYAVTGDSRHHSIKDARRCAAPCIADLAPILNALDAHVVVAGPSGTRSVILDEFYTWSGETVVQPDELIVEVVLPHKTRVTTDWFEKYSQWEGDFAEASVAVRLEWKDESSIELRSARVAFGAVSPFPARSLAVEKALLLEPLSDESIQRAAALAVHGALPLKDNASKVVLLVNLTERAIRKAASRRDAEKFFDNR
jgi:CO/xanthine dehydrogenase Mo-binding subunit/CO/xanthine dehydrogenase FAD-binding subunit